MAIFIITMFTLCGSLVSNVQDSSVYGTSRHTVQLVTAHNNQIVGEVSAAFSSHSASSHSTMYQYIAVY